MAIIQSRPITYSIVTYCLLYTSVMFQEYQFVSIAKPFDYFFPPGRTCTKKQYLFYQVKITVFVFILD